MPPLLERYVSRRRLLQAAAIPFITPLLLACQVPSTPIEKIIPSPTKEKENIPREGDIAAMNNAYYLIRNGMKYLLSNPQEYKRLTKFDKYSRRILPFSPGDFDKYQSGKVSEEKYIIDLFTGQLKENRPLGGEINIYFPGFLTDGAMPYDLLIPRKDTFIAIRKNLEKNKWGEVESLFFTYGKSKFEEYGPKDTAIDPRENIKYALEFFKSLKESFPLVQFNLIGHSLGALFALEVARKYPDAVNNLILLSGPVRGFKYDFVRAQEIEFVRQALMKLGIIEEVIDYLVALWKDKNYQKGLDDFVKSFTASGKKIQVYTSNADSIVFEEEAYLPGVTTIIDAGGRKGGLAAIPRIFEEHSRTHHDPVVQEKINNMIGENLAAAA